MIYYGFSPMKVLAWVVIGILFLCVFLIVATGIVERKTKELEQETEKMRKELEELERQMVEQEDK